MKPDKKYYPYIIEKETIDGLTLRLNPTQKTVLFAVMRIMPWLLIVGNIAILLTANEINNLIRLMVVVVCLLSLWMLVYGYTTGIVFSKGEFVYHVNKFYFIQNKKLLITPDTMINVKYRGGRSPSWVFNAVQQEKVHMLFYIPVTVLNNTEQAKSNFIVLFKKYYNINVI